MIELRQRLVHAENELHLQTSEEGDQLAVENARLVADLEEQEEH